MTISAGTRLGRYEIRAQIGEGGMGEVYLAEDTQLGRRVAIKLLPPETLSDEKARRRLVREAQAAAKLDHPNICAIYEVGEEDGRSFIAMQYVEGETLDARMKRKPLDLAESLAISAQVADALAEAHAHGIMHRDIKPSNIIIAARGQAKVMDFGLAKVVQESGRIGTEAETQPMLTAPDVILGTIPYMSPEQVKGEKLDARTDIFSFGVVLYEMLCGRQPFASESAAATASAILTREPSPVVRFAPAAPEELQRIVRKGLEKDRERRYQTMRDVATDLNNLQRDHELLGRSTASPLANRTAIYTSRRSLPGWTLMAVALLLLSAVGIGLYRWWVNKSARTITSLAVMPFGNVGGDSNTEYLSDGLTESLIDRLSRLPNLKVMSRSAVFRYKGQNVDAKQAAHALNVEAILTGQVTQRGNDLSINIELVDGRDDSHIWGAHYDRKLDDILTVQQDMMREISQRLSVELTGEKQNLIQRSTRNPEAYQLYLRGRYFWNKRTEDGLRKSIEYYEQATKLDPNYALAYVGISDSYGMTTTTLGTFPPSEAGSKAKEAALRALEIDDTLAEAHISLGHVKMFFDWDWPAAEHEFKRGIELNPTYAEAHHIYAHYLMAMRRVSEAFDESQKYLQLDTLNVPAYNHLGWHYLYARQYDQALSQLRKTAEMDPNFLGMLLYFGWVYEQKRMYPEAIATFQQAVSHSTIPLMLASLGHAYAIAGRRDEAKKMLLRLDDLSRQRYVSAYDKAIIYVGLGEIDQSLEWLQRAYQERSQFMIYLDTDPRLDSLRTDERFQNLLRRMHFPQLAASGSSQSDQIAVFNWTVFAKERLIEQNAPLARVTIVVNGTADLKN